jgi:predicted nucleic acid-binding protein
MKVLFDTSVIVTGLVEAHPMHGRAFRWVKQAIVGKFELVVASHTIAESYAVLSSLPVKPRISPLVALKLLRENIVSICKIVSLTPVEYLNTINWIAERSLVGGITYDALIAKVAQKSRVEKLVTMNVDDFMRVWPEGEDVIVAP